MSKLEYALPIYPFHIDAIGHVNNIIYIQWMEIGRVQLLNAVDMPIEQIAQEGFGPALVETNISYKKPLYFGGCRHGLYLAIAATRGLSKYGV